MHSQFQSAAFLARNLRALEEIAVTAEYGRLAELIGAARQEADRQMQLERGGITPGEVRRQRSGEQ